MIGGRLHIPRPADRVPDGQVRRQYVDRHFHCLSDMPERCVVIPAANAMEAVSMNHYYRSNVIVRAGNGNGGFRRNHVTPICRGERPLTTRTAEMQTEALDSPGGRGGLVCPYNQHEYALRVVPERPVPEIRRDALRLVKPCMERQIVGDVAAPFFHGGEGMMIGMRHGCLPQNSSMLQVTSVKRSLCSSVIVRPPTSKTKVPKPPSLISQPAWRSSR